MKLSNYLFTMIVGLLLVATSTSAQTGSNAGERHHDGFYFSFGLGPAFGHIHDKYDSDVYESYKAEWKGTGLLVDMRIGGAVKEDWVLTADLMNKSISSPEIAVNDSNYTTNDDVSMDEITYGVGLTRYFMPLNIYAGVTLGGGTFMLTVTDPETDEATRTRSKFGFSYMVRAGKSWYLGRKWGLGVGVGYGGTSAKISDSTGEEKFDAARFVASITVSYQ